MFLIEPLPDHAKRSSEPNGDPKSEARKPRDRRTALGQVFTPEKLADRMVRHLNIPSLGSNPIILDPCVGPDTFPAAIRRSGCAKWTIEAIDIDDEMCAIASAKKDDRVRVQHIDYLNRPLKVYDAAILNPPYVRQEWIRKKSRLGSFLKKETGAVIPGTANLYVYFIVKVVTELRAGGKMACLVYDSWQSTLYGRWLRDYLDQHCEWISEAVPNCPFEGRLIDATIIYATKRAHVIPSKAPEQSPELLPGHAAISELFYTRRGLRLKQSDFFMTSAARQEAEGSTRFVKKVGRIAGLSVPADHDEAALLITLHQENPRAFKILKQRLAAARRSAADNIAILTWADERPSSWYLHSPAPHAPILFNYFIRHRPKHLANPSSLAYSDNFYGLTPRSDEPHAAWFAAMNSSASSVGILRQARNQGSGLAKLQLFEYRAATVVDIRSWCISDVRRLEALGLMLMRERTTASETIDLIDQLVAEVTNDPRLDPVAIAEELRLADHDAKKP